MRFLVVLTICALTFPGCVELLTTRVFPELQDCPGRWTKHRQKCYLPVARPQLEMSDANVYCQVDGAAVANVNADDHWDVQFITTLLKTSDIGRNTWMVRDDQNDVLYTFTGQTYEIMNNNHISNSTSEKYSFICQIAFYDMFQIIRKDHPFVLWSDRGPAFTAQPRDTLILSDIRKVSSIELLCRANGKPIPWYTWQKAFLNNSETQWMTLESESKSRFLMLGGRLRITAPRLSDRGRYRCVVENSVGTIYSPPALLSFGVLGDFAEANAVVPVSGTANQGAVLECPSIRATPGVTYKWYRSESNAVDPETERNSFVSSNGKLYFSQLSFVDEGDYNCVVSLTNPGRTIPGTTENRVSPTIQLKVSSAVPGQANDQPVIVDDFIFVYPSTPKRGDIVQLECFAYGRALNYSWYRDSPVQTLPQTAAVSTDGRVLTISNAQTQDNGQYRCRVDSGITQTSDQRTINLVIEAKPYFTRSLEDQNKIVTVNSTVTLNCEASAVPAPVYTWYKDGQLLDNSSGIAIVNNILTIGQAHKSRDSGMYQCAAANSHGSVFNSAQIIVLDHRGPKIIVEPEDVLLLSTVPELNLSCNAVGIPEPSYTWQKASSDAPTQWISLDTSPGSRFSLSEGHLNITSVQMSDEGFYRCQATNTVGSVFSSSAAVSFGLLGEFSNINPGEVTGVAFGGVVLRCPDIRTKPGATHVWARDAGFGANPVFIRPELEKHIFVSENGGLYFSELTVSDQSNYVCTVFLSNPGGMGKTVGIAEHRVSLKVPLKVTPAAAPASSPPVIAEEFITVFPSNPLKGQTVRLECFAYGALQLNYTWYRDSPVQELPSTAVMSDDSRVLTISNIQPDDQGQYRCQVHSTVSDTPDEKSIMLNIEAAPYFTVPPRDQQVSIGSNVSISCQARASPSPRFTWYKEGQLLSNGSGISIMEDTLTINHVQKSRDEGMYQCVASNVHGTAFSSAQIAVLDPFAPSFAKQRVPRSMIAPQGSRVVIQCSPQASPIPAYKWFLNGTDLGLEMAGPAVDGKHVLESGSLVIDKVDVMKHPGTYTCIASNSLGYAVSSGHLRIMLPTPTSTSSALRAIFLWNIIVIAGIVRFFI